MRDELLLLRQIANLQHRRLPISSHSLRVAGARLVTLLQNLVDHDLVQLTRQGPRLTMAGLVVAYGVPNPEPAKRARHRRSTIGRAA